MLNLKIIDINIHKHINLNKHKQYIYFRLNIPNSSIRFIDAQRPRYCITTCQEYYIV